MTCTRVLKIFFWSFYTLISKVLTSSKKCDEITSFFENILFFSRNLSNGEIPISFKIISMYSIVLYPLLHSLIGARNPENSPPYRNESLFYLEAFFQKHTTIWFHNSKIFWCIHDVFNMFSGGILDTLRISTYSSPKYQDFSPPVLQSIPYCFTFFELRSWFKNLIGKAR